MSRDEFDRCMALASTLNDRRVELLKTVNVINASICALVGHADRLRPAVADETEIEEPRKKKVEALPQVPMFSEEGPRRVAEYERKHARKCSFCDEPGHDIRNCPRKGEAALKDRRQRKKK